MGSVVEWQASSGNTPPSGVRDKPEIACVSECACFGNSAEKHTQSLDGRERSRANVKLPPCFHVSQAQ